MEGDSAETSLVSEKSEIADEIAESSQRLVDQKFTELPSCSFAERVCSLRQGSTVVLGVSSIWRGFLKCKICPLWLPFENILRQTSTVHAKEPGLGCPLCGQTFSFFCFCINITSHIRKECMKIVTCTMKARLYLRKSMSLKKRLKGIPLALNPPSPMALTCSESLEKVLRSK